MPRPKKDGVYVNFYMRRDVKEKLAAYCDEVGQTTTTAIERILDEHLSKRLSEKEKQD